MNRVVIDSRRKIRSFGIGKYGENRRSQIRKKIWRNEDIKAEKDGQKGGLFPIIFFLCLALY